MDLSFEKLPQAVSQLIHDVNNIKEILLTLKNSEEQVDRILTVPEAATFLRVSIPTIYRLVHLKDVPVSKQGKRLYFSTLDLTDWVKAGKKKTITEIREETDIAFARTGGNHGK